MTQLHNPTEFFNALRGSKLLGDLEQSEVDGLNAILKAGGDAGWPLAYVAYSLATAFHETAHTLQPISEYGGDKYFTKMYDITGTRPDLARQNGNTTAGDGPKYKGRGYVQLTWKNNYKKAETKCGIAGLVANPDLAMKTDNAAKIMTSGMSEGWFTGVSCSTYLPTNGAKATHAQFKSARKIINGQDKADTIADYAEQFQTALVKGEWK